MIREELPSIVFIALILIISIAGFFQILKIQDDRFNEIYFHREILSILERKMAEFQDGNLIKEEINKTQWNNGFISLYDLEVKNGNLLKVSLPALINATNPQKVNVYAWK